MCFYPIRCLPLDEHIPRGDCTCIACMKIIEVIFKEEIEKPK